MNHELLKPRALRMGDTIGVFTPSSPAYIWNEGLFLNGLKTLESLGFKVKLGPLTEARGQQGYRSGTAEDRASEFMDLVKDPGVHGLMSTIGGLNSASLIPFLDFERIRKERKPVCGFSDVTALHLSILKFAGLRTLYGPSVMCWFGDWPTGVEESSKWFIEAAVHHKGGVRAMAAPVRWSNHKRRWDNEEWRTLPRQWEENDGWRILNAGSVEAPILACNLNTMMSCAGTPYWPDLSGRILLIEDMEAPLGLTERRLRQFKSMGGFDQIAGLIVSKPEVYIQEGAPFTYDDLFTEIIGPRPYPIVSNFDCGHTVPMITIPQLSRVALKAERGKTITFEFLDGGVE